MHEWVCACVFPNQESCVISWKEKKNGKLEGVIKDNKSDDSSGRKTKIQMFLH